MAVDLSSASHCAAITIVLPDPIIPQAKLTKPSPFNTFGAQIHFLL